MKRWMTFAVLVVAVLIAHRAPSPPPAGTDVKPVESSIVELEVENDTPNEVEPQSATESRTEDEERRVRRRAIYDAMIERLIASIDWTRADSRVRFPAECALIEAQFGPPDE